MATVDAKKPPSSPHFRGDHPDPGATVKFSASVLQQHDSTLSERGSWGEIPCRHARAGSRQESGAYERTDDYHALREVWHLLGDVHGCGRRCIGGPLRSIRHVGRAHGYQQSAMQPHHRAARSLPGLAGWLAGWLAGCALCSSVCHCRILPYRSLTSPRLAAFSSTRTRSSTYL